jgi:DNA-binding response OmpR family regulator
VVAQVLLIEDETPRLRLIAWFLADSGHEVALRPVPVQSPAEIPARAPNVIVLNTGLDPGDKQHAVTLLRSAAPGVPVIDLTDAAYPACTASGADVYLHLPLYPYALLDAIAACAPVPA